MAADEVVRSSNFRFGVAPFDIKWCRELESLIRKKTASGFDNVGLVKLGNN